MQNTDLPNSGGVGVLERLKKLFNKYFDYEIIGEYYDRDGHGNFYKKYLKRYHLRKGVLK